jgi:lactoylglutathione lyase
MQLGAFSISLAVTDLAASRQFYETLGFEVFHGEPEQHWLMLRNGDTVIGLFEGMFEDNILTFNPGWDQAAQELDDFTDIREIQAHLKAHGLALDSETDASATGPGSLTLKDPDGNRIMLDQHR